MHGVDSTCAARLGYDEELEEVLVEFHDSSLYGYRPVPPEVYANSSWPSRRALSSTR
jgi:KTSC domain